MRRESLAFNIMDDIYFQAFTQRFKEKASYDKIDANDDVKDWLDNMTFDKKGWASISPEMQLI